MALAADAASAVRYHYVRPNDNADINSKWRFVVAGPYVPTVAAPAPRFTWTRQYTAAEILAAQTAGTVDKSQLGLPDNYTYAAAVDVALPAALPLIQWNNVDWPGPHALTTTGSGNAFPFGAFARNGDILQVPFIGGYRIINNTDSTQTLELNSVTVDAWAADVSTMNDTIEQVGRFCPGLVTAPAVDPYAWASDLFDYLTVQCPANDYLPDVDHDRYVTAGAPAPLAVANGSNPSLINYTTATTEDNAPINGLININTASWKVLSTLPMVTNSDGTINTAANDALAKLIFQDRIKNGPFQSIFDLNRIVDSGGNHLFTSLNGTIAPATLNPGNTDGDITPLVPPGTDDGVAGDFEARYLALNRLSNLITTRSDSFTVYIVVEGWQNAGTTSAQRVTQRRAAYIIDRSGVTSAQTDPQITYVPNQ
jgi:hypothetical protein